MIPLGHKWFRESTQAATRLGCKLSGFGLRRFESSFSHHTRSRSPNRHKDTGLSLLVRGFESLRDHIGDKMKCNDCVNKETCTKNYDFLMDLDNDCEDAKFRESYTMIQIQQQNIQIQQTLGCSSMVEQGPYKTPK
jgi:hypothetical protein